jgi:hypothetical protein
MMSQFGWAWNVPWCRRTQGFASGRVIDCENIETTFRSFDVADGTKFPRHAREVAAFFPIHGVLGNSLKIRR